MVQLTKAYNQVIKKFLIETFGFENINAYCVIDSEIIGFRIRQMNFLIDCETMSIKRELERTEDGTDSYNELVDLLADVLDDYKVEDEDGVEFDTKEKRIYAPNVVAVVNGKAIKMIEGVSDKLEDPYSELTEEMKTESYQSFKCLWE